MLVFAVQQHELAISIYTYITSLQNVPPTPLLFFLFLLSLYVNIHICISFFEDLLLGTSLVVQ